jgi:hypothetical protein
MFFRIFTRLLALGSAALSLASCTLFEPGGPSAAITVKAESAYLVTDVVERVFIDEGYKPISRTGDGLTFEGKASKTDEIFYGDWNESDVSQRVKVVIANGSGDTFRVRCMPFVVRDPHDVSFEDEHRRMQIFSLHYGKMLREVRRQCLELSLTRKPYSPETSG